MKLKKRLFIVKALTLALVMMLAVTLAAPVYAGGPAEPSDPPTEEEIAGNITAGLKWLANQQYGDGSWGTSYEVAHTGLALLKFETHATFLGMSPLDPGYMYSSNVSKGLEYLFNTSANYSIGVEPAGNPDTNGNGIGVRCYADRVVYETSIALMAICGSNAPGQTVGTGSQTGRTYAEVAQDMVDFLAWAQVDPAYGNQRGGWRYTGDDSSADNSVSGYASIGLIYAEAPPPWGFSLVVPAFVFSELEYFVAAVQDTGGGDDDGGSWYVPGSSPWVNCLKTGNLLSELGLVGATTANASVQAAVDYLERNWNDLNNGYSSGQDGWYGTTKPSYQACFTMMKGFQALGIETINATGSYFSWYDAVAERICNTQNPNGSWSGDPWGDDILATAWAMLALEKAAPPALLLLPPFDINEPGESHTVTAVYKIAGVPQEDVQINFEVISGPNAGDMSSDNTSATGEATFTYTGDGGEGTDTIKATAVDEFGTPLVSSQVTKVWERTTPPVEVGGEVYPINKLNILAPWVALAATLIVGAAVLVRRRRAGC